MHFHLPHLPHLKHVEHALAEAEKGQAPTMDLGWLAAMIDHTLLKPGAGEEELARLCEEAREYSFAAVCVRPENVRFCAGALRDSAVKPISVVGFPEGGVPTAAKVDETRRAILDGAREIDMVIAFPLLRERLLRETAADIAAVVAAAGAAPVKVILENCLLSEEEKVMASTLAKSAGAAFVKTSTGFSAWGATTEDIALMRRIVGPSFGVKASGGVRTLADALRMVMAGANRIGTSSGVSIVGKSSPAPAQNGIY